MDINKYRKKRTDPYLGGALSYGEVQEFLHRHNRPGERRCISCNKPFPSEGAHNRKCPTCKNKHEMRANHTVSRELIEYKSQHNYKPCHAFRGEID